MISRTHHRRMVFPLCVCVCACWEYPSVCKYNRTHHRRKDVLLYACACGQRVDVSMQNHRDYMKMVCFLYEYLDVCSSCISLWNLYDIQCIWGFSASFIVEHWYGGNIFLIMIVIPYVWWDFYWNKAIILKQNKLLLEKRLFFVLEESLHRTSHRRTETYTPPPPLPSEAHVKP